MQTNPDIAADPYGIRVSDSPYYPTGSLIFVDPNEQPVRDDPVLVWPKDQQTPVIAILAAAPPPAQLRDASCENAKPLLVIRDAEDETRTHRIDFQRIQHVHKIVASEDADA